MLARLGVEIGLLLIRVLCWLPRGVTRALGGALGIVGYYFVSSRRKVGLINLSLCFPEMSEEKKHEIIKQHFKYLVTAVLEYGLVFFASPAKITKYIKLKNLDNLLEHYKKRPIILLCPHFVGLDLGAARLCLEVIGDSMYSRQKGGYIDKRLKAARLRFIKDKDAEIFSRQEGLRTIIRRMRQKNTLFYYLPDQDFGARDSIYVPFFGQKSCATVNVLPKLVELTNAVVIGCAVYRTNTGYEMEFLPAWEDYPTGNLEADVKRMNEFVESVVIKDLPQYFWLHKRFKTQPDGRHKLYTNC